MPSLLCWREMFSGCTLTHTQIHIQHTQTHTHMYNRMNVRFLVLVSRSLQASLIGVFLGILFQSR